MYQTGLFYFDDPVNGRSYYQVITHPDGTQEYQILPSPQIQDRLFLEHARAGIKYELELALLQAKEASRMRIEDHKAELRRKQLEGMEQRTLQRELAKTSVFRTQNGQFAFELVYPSGEHVVTWDILDAPFLRLVRIKQNSFRVELMLLFYAQGKYMCMVDEQCSLDGFIAALNRAGIVIALGRRYLYEAQRQLFLLLVSEAAEWTILRHFGWCQTESGWKFADENEITEEDLLIERYRI